MNNMKKKMIFMPIFFIAMIIIVGFAVMYLWNWLMPDASRNPMPTSFKGSILDSAEAVDAPRTTFFEHVNFARAFKREDKLSRIGMTLPIVSSTGAEY